LIIKNINLSKKIFSNQIIIGVCLLVFLSVFSLQAVEVLAVPIPSSGPIPESPRVPYVPIPEVPPVPEVPVPEAPPVPEVPVPELLLSWFTGFTSALFSWDSTSWEGMKQYAIGHWQSMAQEAEKEGSPLEYFYKFMGFLAEQGSRGSLALLALSVIPFASIGKLFASGSFGPKLTMDIINSSLSNIAVVFKNLPSGLAGIAGIGNGVKYTQAGTVAIKQALAGNPIASVISKHEIAHLLGASEVQAWKITSQAFSLLSLGDKIRSLGTLAGVNTGLYWLLGKTLPALNNTLLQAQYLFTKGITKNIWRGY